MGGAQRARLGERWKGEVGHPQGDPGCRQQEVQPRPHSPAGLHLGGQGGLFPQHQLLFLTQGNSALTPPLSPLGPGPTQIPASRKLALALPILLQPKGGSPRTSGWYPDKGSLRLPGLGEHGLLGSRPRWALPMGPRGPVHLLPCEQGSS